MKQHFPHLILSILLVASMGISGCFQGEQSQDPPTSTPPSKAERVTQLHLSLPGNGTILVPLRFLFDTQLTGTIDEYGPLWSGLSLYVLDPQPDGTILLEEIDESWGGPEYSQSKYINSLTGEFEEVCWEDNRVRDSRDDPACRHRTRLAEPTLHFPIQWTGTIESGPKYFLIYYKGDHHDVWLNFTQPLLRAPDIGPFPEMTMASIEHLEADYMDAEYCVEFSGWCGEIVNGSYPIPSGENETLLVMRLWTRPPTAFAYGCFAPEPSRDWRECTRGPPTPTVDDVTRNPTGSLFWRSVKFYEENAAPERFYLNAGGGLGTLPQALSFYRLVIEVVQFDVPERHPLG